MPNNCISHLKILYCTNFKDRIERNSFASTIKLKLHLVLFYPSVWYICDFYLFHIEIEEKCGWIIGGPKGMLAPPPPSQIIGGPGPLWPPSSYAYVYKIFFQTAEEQAYFLSLVYFPKYWLTYWQIRRNKKGNNNMLQVSYYDRELLGDNPSCF